VVDTEREIRRGEAFDVAWRLLNHRDRTEAELVRAFLKARVEPELAEDVLGELRESGYVDDARFAVRFAEDRRRLDAWGSDRIERRLSELGVAREDIAAALGEGGHNELEAAVARQERRFSAPPSTPPERDPARGVQIRKGYDLELAHDALRRFAGATVD
jgi:regulatory protein